MGIKLISSISDEVYVLIQMSREYQAGLYPPDSIHQEDPQALLAQNIYFIGAYLDNDLLGIGGVKRVDATPQYGEIKNLFVDPKHRGRGASRVIMGALEQHLVDNKIMLCCLETGPNQPESVGLYKSLGYQECAAYGDYKPDPLSLFMQKAL
jgi:putative acetyltransferase